MNKETRRFIAYGLLTAIFGILGSRAYIRYDAHQSVLNWHLFFLVLNFLFCLKYANLFAKTIR